MVETWGTALGEGRGSPAPGSSGLCDDLAQCLMNESPLTSQAFQGRHRMRCLRLKSSCNDGGSYRRSTVEKHHKLDSYFLAMRARCA